jgi:hypothetical protein
MVKPMAERFDDILSECIDRMLQGESLEQCLARYPEHAKDLGPLLRTATSAREASAVEPCPEFKAQVRYRVQSRASAATGKAVPKGTPALGWIPRWAMAVVSIFLVLLVAGSGTVAASSTSMPDDTLYPLKLATENVRLGLNRSDIGKARFHVGLADRRINEIAYLLRKGNVDRAERIALRLTGHLEAIQRIIESQAGRPGTEEAIEELKQMLQERVQGNEALLERAREGEVDQSGIVGRVLERYRQGYQRVLGLSGGYNS